MRTLKPRKDTKHVENFTYFNVQDSFFNYDYSKRYNPGIIQPHFHNAYELLWFMRGSAVYTVEGHVYELKENDLLITNPRELHRPNFTEKAVYERSIVFVKPAFLSEFVSEEYNPFWGLEQRKVGTQNLIDGEYVVRHGIDKIMQKIGYYATRRLPESRALIKAYVVQLLNEVNSAINVEKIKGEQSSKIFDIIVYINQNIFDKVTLDMLEEKFFMSKYHISHIFKQQTGFTVVEYITRKRILYAKELMISGMPAGEAAEKSGFYDYSVFYKAFRKVTGGTPSDFIGK